LRQLGDNRLHTISRTLPSYGRTTWQGLYRWASANHAEPRWPLRRLWRLRWTKCLRCSLGAIAARICSRALVSWVGVYYDQGEDRTFLRAIHTWDRGVLAGRPVGHCGSGDHGSAASAGTRNAQGSVAAVPVGIGTFIASRSARSLCDKNGSVDMGRQWRGGSVIGGRVRLCQLQDRESQSRFSYHS